MQDYTIDDFNPCRNCNTTECGLIDGQECNKERAFEQFKHDYFTFKHEAEIARSFIKENDLEWALISFLSKNTKEIR